MKKTMLALTLLGVIGVGAANAETPLFSPYIDTTLDVHWVDTQGTIPGHLAPVDWATISKSNGVKNYHLGFITEAGNCHAAWGGFPDYSAANLGWIADINRLRTSGINYTVAFGGFSGTDISVACNDKQLVDAYEKLIKDYQPQGLDFDIENQNVNVPKIMKALQLVQKNHPSLKISFTLPVMPEGLVDGFPHAGMEVVRQAKAASLNYTVNIMAMDYGPTYTASMGGYAVQAATSLYNYLHKLYPTKSEAAIWKMIEVTPMIGVNDTMPEKFSLQDVDTLRNFAKQKGIAALAFWSANRDHPCAQSAAVDNHCSGASLQTQHHEYAKRFMQ